MFKSIILHVGLLMPLFRLYTFYSVAALPPPPFHHTKIFSEKLIPYKTMLKLVVPLCTYSQTTKFMIEFYLGVSNQNIYCH